MIDKITVAVDKMEDMVAFYGSLFNTSFQDLDLYGEKLFAGKIGDIEVLFCPKHIAGVDARINTIQLRFVIEDVEKALKVGLEKGGTLITDVQELDGHTHASLRDPDGNSLEIKQNRSEK